MHRGIAKQLSKLHGVPHSVLINLEECEIARLRRNLRAMRGFRLLCILDHPPSPSHRFVERAARTEKRANRISESKAARKCGE
jgi:hypothetical protein